MTENYSNKIKPIGEIAYYYWKEYRPLIIKYVKNWKCPDIEDAYNQSYVYIFEALARYSSERKKEVKCWILFYLKQKLFNYIKTKTIPVSRSYHSLKNPDLCKVKSIVSIENSENVENLIGDKDNRYIYSADVDKMLDTLSYLINRLEPRQRYVITSYYGIGTQKKTLKELAIELNVSFQMIRSIRVRAERKLLSIANGKNINIGELLDYEA